MNKKTEEVIDKITDVLRQQDVETQKESPNITPSLTLSTFSQSEIEELEREFKIKVPRIQKEFIKKYAPVRFHIMYTDIYGVTGLKKELTDYIPDELIQEGLLPFAGSEGDYYCLNMEQDEDKVYFFNHEEYNVSETDMTFEDFFKDLLQAKMELKKNDSM